MSLLSFCVHRRPSQPVSCLCLFWYPLPFLPFTFSYFYNGNVLTSTCTLLRFFGPFIYETYLKSHTSANLNFVWGGDVISISYPSTGFWSPSCYTQICLPLYTISLRELVCCIVNLCGRFLTFTFPVLCLFLQTGVIYI